MVADLFYATPSSKPRSAPVHSWNIHLSILKLTGKTEYAKHLVRNITCSRAAGQNNNITDQTASEQVLFYLRVQRFATIVSIKEIWEVGVRGEYTPSPPPPHTSISTSRNGMRWNFVPGISLVQWWRSIMPLTMYMTGVYLMEQRQILKYVNKNGNDFINDFVCQGDILSKVSRSYQVSNLRK